VNTVEYDDNLKVWVFDFHGDLIVLDAHDYDSAIEERDSFLMGFGNDVDNGMGD
jgi:hypothetical protein